MSPRFQTFIGAAARQTFHSRAAFPLAANQ